MKLVLVIALITLTSFQDIMANSCRSAADCQPDECCRIGMQRYSTPSCMKLGQEGGHCRRENTGRDMTLHYPDGSKIEGKGLYTLFCPCKPSLQCEKGTCN